MSDLKKRIQDLYRFLKEANQLNHQPVRQLTDQPKTFNLASLPNHQDVQLTRPVTTQDGQDIPDVLLRVKRPELTPCPPPPHSIARWLEAGWDDPFKAPQYIENRNQLVKGKTVTVQFEDDRERVSAFAAWTAQRKIWATPEISSRRASQAFEALYEFYSVLEKDTGQLELLIADGHLLWKTTTIHGTLVTINHPILLKRAEIRFDPVKPEFTVHETDRDTEIYTSLVVDLAQVSQTALKSRQNELSLSGYHPLGWDDTESYMKAIVQTLSPLKGEFLPKPPAMTASEFPVMWRSPTLLIRKRVVGIANAIDAILDDINNQTEFTSSLGQITGVIPVTPPCGFGSTEGDGFRPGTAHSEDILLAKEANEEQVQIIRRLDRSGSVLVQGPPGTGKSHSIGNIIGHLYMKNKVIN